MTTETRGSPIIGSTGTNKQQRPCQVRRRSVSVTMSLPHLTPHGHCCPPQFTLCGIVGQVSRNSHESCVVVKLRIARSTQVEPCPVETPTSSAHPLPSPFACV